MAHHLDDNKLVQYKMRLSGDNSEGLSIDLNSLIGHEIKLEFLGQINCINCNQPSKTSFNQGYCYRCFIKLAECDICILKPELCHYDKGTCRDEEFGKEYCNITHSVYLSITSGLKVGITRQSQEQTRWVDQGASYAIRLLSTKRRYHAGLIESSLSSQIQDKTNWRNMLKNIYPVFDLSQKSKEVISLIQGEFKSNKELDYIIEEASIFECKYPVLEYPQKITSHNLEQKPILEGILLGIKGQYLILDTAVINIRKYTGYLVEFNDT